MICSLTTYRKTTRDFESYDGDVVTALESAQRLFEHKTDRWFELGERTESLKIHNDWLAYPRATPLVSVIAPVGARVVQSNSIYSLVSLYATANWYTYPKAYANVTYIGGFTPEAMPEDVVRAVAELAQYDLRSNTSKIPVGATTIHVGDVSFSGQNLGSNQILPAHISRTIRLWRRREL